MLFNPFETTRGRLINSWRQIEPGMEAHDVDSLLGPPMYDYPVGSDGSVWLSDNLHGKFQEDHSVRAYYIGHLGPQFLLVVFDAEGKVVFVGSAAT